MSLISRPIKAIDRLRIGQQVYGAFAVVLVLTAVAGGLGLFSLARVESQASTLSDKWLTGVGQLAVTRTSMLGSRELEVKYSRSDDRSYRVDYEEKMAEAAKTGAAAMGIYRGLVASDVERALLDAFNKNWVAYQQAQQRVVGLGRDNRMQDAADVSDGLGSMTIDDAIIALDALTKYNFDGGKASAERAAAVYRQARASMLAVVGISLLLGMLLAYLITRHLLRQLGGDPRTAVAVVQAVAEGDLTTMMRLAPEDSESLMARLSAVQHGLVDAVTSVRRGAENVAIASAEIAQGNQDLSGLTEQQASALQETAASMEALGAAVKQNAENARQANQLAMGASTVAIRGGDVFDQVVGTMKGINDSSQKIADFISVIDSIAFQTNILALNAAVEAARAGEQRRGFAVVASEVRNLAQRSADAAREIKALITESVPRVEQGSALVDDAGAMMSEVVTAIKRVTDIMGEISSASSEQSASVTQVGEAINHVYQTTQQNAALVEESAAAAESLRSQANELVQAVAVLKVGTGDLRGRDSRAASVAKRAPDLGQASNSGLRAPERPGRGSKPLRPSVASTATYPEIERRGPNRARNVSRIAPGRKAVTADDPGDTVSSGGDMEWTTF